MRAGKTNLGTLVSLAMSSITMLITTCCIARTLGENGESSAARDDSWDQLQLRHLRIVYTSMLEIGERRVHICGMHPEASIAQEVAAYRDAPLGVDTGTRN